MRKWLWLISIGAIVLGWFIFDMWQESSRDAIIGKALNSHIDTVSIRDTKTNEEVLVMTNSDPAFTPMVEIYRFPYIQLERPDNKILKEEPVLEIEYLQENEVMYVVRVHQFNRKPVLEQQLAASYIYSPENSDNVYFFEVRGNDQLVKVNDGLKTLIDIITSK
ncbi:histone acetyltransferase [Solibacillus sp. FSL W7-1436]|uniref:histone acetyltransferase n=1 Tax=Solibacillus sp. FSL W7-1436 TaxID=2921705 RepID=UPI0030F665EF